MCDMETKRCSSQRLKESGSPAVGKKRKKKKKAEANDLAEIPGETPPPSFSCRQKTSPGFIKKQYPGGSHGSSEVSSNSSIGKLLVGATAASSCSSLESSKPASKTTRVSEQPPSSKSPSNGGVPPPKPHLKSREVDGDGLPTASDTRESLRWEHHCSDEERERERIEEYKKNRRKRYTRQFKVLQRTSHPSPFYTPSQSIS